jgi:hypothetical protein
MLPWSKVNVFLTIAMCVLYGLPGPSNVDMSARSFQYGYCQCAWQSWCWQHNRDCWPCASVWSAGFAQGEAAAAAAQRASVGAARQQQDSVEVQQQDSSSIDEELVNQWEADLNLSEAARDADAAEAAAQEKAEQEHKRKQEHKKADKKVNKKSKAEGSGGGAAQKKSE